MLYSLYWQRSFKQINVDNNTAMQKNQRWVSSFKQKIKKKNISIYIYLSLSLIHLSRIFQQINYPAIGGAPMTMETPASCGWPRSGVSSSSPTISLGRDVGPGRFGSHHVRNHPEIPWSNKHLQFTHILYIYIYTHGNKWWCLTWKRMGVLCYLLL